MGEQRNLTEENVTELRELLDKMKEGNPDLEYMFYKQREDREQIQESEPDVSNDRILAKLEAIERQLKLIFDDHVLINGQFKRTSTIKGGCFGNPNKKTICRSRKNDARCVL